MRINTNLSALNANRQLGITQDQVSASMAKLSSGFRINRAADDAAGLGIANRIRGDIRSMTQASRNSEQANSLLQIAEGATSGIQTMLERMKELATQANSDTVDVAGRGRIDAEFQQLKTEITRTVSTTKFQGKTLLDGSFGNSVNTATSSALAAGAYSATTNGTQAGTYTLASTVANAGKLTIDDGNGNTQTISVAADGKQTVSFDKFGITLDLDASFTTSAAAAGSLDTKTVVVTQGAGGGSFMIGSSGSYSSLDLLSLNSTDLTTGATGLNIATTSLTSATNAQGALTAIDSAIGTVNGALGNIGAYQNRIENAQSNLKTAIQNYSASESVIRDLDMADEMTKFSKNQVLAQAGTAMLAQANQSSQGILSLLRG